MRIAAISKVTLFVILSAGFLTVIALPMISSGKPERRASYYDPALKNHSTLDDMVLILPGEFMMGSNKGEPEEQPPHPVHLDAYFIGRYEVTNYCFARFVAESGFRTKAENEGYSWIWKDNSKVKKPISKDT